MTADSSLLRNRHDRELIDCEHCESRIEAARIIAASHNRVADAIDRAFQHALPLMNSANEMFIMANGFCRFWRRWTIPALFMILLSGAITPDVAKGFHNLLRILGAAG